MEIYKTNLYFEYIWFHIFENEFDVMTITNIVSLFII